MESSYIKRRIDELGRFVIPKEIRKTLKIRDNDQLEINVIDNKIILSKYENYQKDKIVSLIMNVIKKYLSKNVLFTSKDVIIDYDLLTKESIINKSLDSEIIKIIEKRKIVSSESNIKLNDDIIINNYLINPIIINGDIYGSIIIFGKDVSALDKEIMGFVNIFLENYLE